MLTRLGLQSHCGDKTLEIRVTFRFLYTAVLNGLREYKGTQNRRKTGGKRVRGTK